MPSPKTTAVGGLDTLPLHALVSAALVAFTIESDDEVELGHAARGQAGRFSLVAWLNVVQFLAAGPQSVAELCARTSTKPAQIGFVIGCLERWGFVSVVAKPGGSPRATHGEGFGSARAVTARSTVDVTEKGRGAVELWPGVIDVVESRWQRRHGSALTAVLDAMSQLAAAPGVVMPEGVPSGWMQGDWRQFPAGELEEPRGARLPVLLGRALLAVTIAYEHRSTIRLALAANTLRVVEDGGTPVSELHRRSGISSETTGAQCTALQRLGLAELVKDSSSRGKVLKLTVVGATAQAAHAPAIEEVERAFGADATNASERAARTARWFRRWRSRAARRAHSAAGRTAIRCTGARARPRRHQAGSDREESRARGANRRLPFGSVSDAAPLPRLGREPRIRTLTTRSRGEGAMTEAAAEYRRRADAFERLIAHTPRDRWTSPSPCVEWNASEVVAHVVDFSAQVLLERAGIDDAPRFSAFAEPLDAFLATRAVVEGVLDDPATEPAVISYLQWSISFDLPQHGWDLAMATGQDPTIAPEELELLWGSGDPDAFERAFGWQRENGWYGPPVEVPEDAPLQDRVLGVLGRDPNWSA